MTAVSTVLVGRRQERAVLDAELELAREGQPRVVLIDGPAGIGKTALVQQFLADVRGTGLVSAVVAGDDQEAQLAFGVVARLMAALEDLPPPPVPTGDTDPIAIGTAMLGCLGEAQRSGTVVLVVDEAQWADHESLHAIAFVLRRLHADRVLCLLVARDATADLPDGLVRLGSGIGGRRLTLSGLGVDEVVTMAEAAGLVSLPRTAADRLRDHTGGNPLHIRALLHELDERELTGSRGPLPAPRSYHMLILSRLAGCEPATQQLVSAAAVCGHRTPLDLVAEVAGLADPLPAVDDAVAAGFLRLADTVTTRALVFTHPLVRAAVYHDLGPARRCRLHAAAAMRTSDLTALQHRIAAATTTDAALSVELEGRAADELARGAATAAGQHLVEAARLAADGERRQCLLLQAVTVLLHAGRATDVLQLVDDVRALPHSQHRSYVLGGLAMLVGDHDEADRELSRAWEADGVACDPSLAARAALQLGDLRIVQAQPADAVRWARRAMSGALDPACEGTARRVLALGLAMSGDPDGLEAVADLPNTPTVHPATSEPLLARGIVRLWEGDLPGAHDDLFLIASAREEQCPLRIRLGGAACLAKTRFHIGDWDGALGAVTMAIELAEDAEHRWALAFLHASAVLVPAARGQWADAVDKARRAAQAAQATRHGTDLAYAAHAEAQIAFARADAAGVLAAVEPVLGLVADGRVEEPGAMPWYELYVDALVAQERLDEAERAIGRLEASVSPRRRHLSAAHAARLRGNLEAVRGNTAAARAAFDSGLTLLSDSPAVFDRALLQHAYGRFLRRCGQRDEAVRHLQASANAFTSLQAAPFLERCERELARCGVTPARRSQEAPFDLTPQEVVVSQLVASGLSNRDVAAKLVLSVKTIEYHLGNVYRKLGVSSRTQLAARLVGRPATPDAASSDSARRAT